MQDSQFQPCSVIEIQIKNILSVPRTRANGNAIFKAESLCRHDADTRFESVDPSKLPLKRLTSISSC